jgi:hypothetical protein
MVRALVVAGGHFRLRPSATKLLPVTDAPGGAERLTPQWLFVEATNASRTATVFTYFRAL